MLWECTIPSYDAAASVDNPKDFEIHRLKGILFMEDGSTKVIQAVREVFDIRDVDQTESSDAERQCKIALIGRGLGHDAGPWQRSFDYFLRHR